MDLSLHSELNKFDVSTWFQMLERLIPCYMTPSKILNIRWSEKDMLIVIRLPPRLYNLNWSNQTQYIYSTNFTISHACCPYIEIKLQLSLQLNFYIYYFNVSNTVANHHDDRQNFRCLPTVIS